MRKNGSNNLHFHVNCGSTYQWVKKEAPWTTDISDEVGSFSWYYRATAGVKLHHFDNVVVLVGEEDVVLVCSRRNEGEPTSFCIDVCQLDSICDFPLVSGAVQLQTNLPKRFRGGAH